VKIKISAPWVDILITALQAGSLSRS